MLNNCVYLNEINTVDSLEIKPISMESNLRSDGRISNELRKMLFELSYIKNATGSAYVELGDTKIICCIRGPHTEHRSNTVFSDTKGVLECDVKIAPWYQPENKKKFSNIMSQYERKFSNDILDAIGSSVLLEKSIKLN
jgi:exosome complex component MTR3